MEQNKKPEFEKTLKDILTPYDSNTPDTRMSVENTGVREKDHTKNEITKGTIVPWWVDISIRIIAAGITLYFIFLFALNIATK